MPHALDPSYVATVRRRSLLVLSLGQVLGGVAFGATVSLGALLAADVSGDEGLSGLATAAVTLGTAAFAVPLAALAKRSGRRPALATGMLIALVGVALVVLARAVDQFPLLLAAFALIGAGQAANLQSRFAASDLATDATRSRDLSLVVWATTIGAVLGPNLVGPGEALGRLVGMPSLTGPYLFTVAAQLLGVAMYLILLRPDPLVLAQRVARDGATSASTVRDHPAMARFAILAVAGSHAVMVSVMAMTPIHLMHHGAEITVVGLTISLHIAGMYALSPVFGVLSDRMGRIPTILLGQAILVASLLLAFAGQASVLAVGVALVLLGLGWSASTVAGAALLTESSSPEMRVARQGRSDLTMSLVGAAGAIGAGVLLGWIGYGGLALVSLIVVAVVVAAALVARQLDR